MPEKNLHLGSSPLTRGARGQSNHHAHRNGLIPARAGNTKVSYPFVELMGAHPRSRGEHHRSKNFRMTVRGSSPLARGTRGHSCPSEVIFGLIPARAGNTSSRSRFCSTMRAHPRSRGEHGLSKAPPRCWTGSSPLARGTHHPGRTQAPRQGLIPARAGNTLQHVNHRSGSRAHPRSRGEHIDSHDELKYLAGSSPLARGTQRTRHGGRYQPGLIPARAGNTSVS